MLKHFVLGFQLQLAFRPRLSIAVTCSTRFTYRKWDADWICGTASMLLEAIAGGMGKS